MKKAATIGVMMMVVVLAVPAFGQRSERQADPPARVLRRPEQSEQRQRAEAQARMAQTLQTQIDELKAAHQDLIAQLRAVHATAVKEKATETAEQIGELIRRQQETLQAKLRPLEQRQQRLQRAARERAVETRPARRRDREAPQFELASFTGRKVNLADYKGRFVVLEWFNFECPFVKYHYDQVPTMANLAKKYRDKNVVWLAVNSTSHTTPEANREYAKKHDLPYPILDDRSGRVGRSYGAQTTPHMYIIDPDGYIVYNGAIDNAPLGKQQEGAEGRINYVDQALSELLSNQRVSMPTTRPYGCTVKYASQ